MNNFKNKFKLDNNQASFIAIKKLEQLTKSTILTYRKVFSRAYKANKEYFQYGDNTKLEEQVLKFFEDISFYTPSAYNTNIKKLNCYFRYLVDKNIIESNPIKTIPIKTRKDIFEPKPCKTEDLKNLLSAIDKKSFTGHRDYVIIMLIVDTGIRPTECLRLIKKDIDLENDLITVSKENSKTNQKRYLPISKQVRKLLKDIIKDIKDDDIVFQTKAGHIMSTARLRARMKIYSDYVNVRITPYQLRHYFGTEYARNDKSNLLYLQKIMGHSDINMTRRYIGIDTKDLQRNHNIASPIKKLEKE